MYVCELTPVHAGQETPDAIPAAAVELNCAPAFVYVSMCVCVYVCMYVCMYMH